MVKPERFADHIATLILLGLKRRPDWYLCAELIAERLEAAAHRWRMRGMLKPRSEQTRPSERQQPKQEQEDTSRE